MAAPNARLVQADKHMAEGQAFEGTTWLRWNPDWDQAVAEYEKAANLFRAAGALDKAKEAYKRAGASKFYEQAATIAKEGKQLRDAAALYEKASICIRETGVSEKAAQCMVLAAKAIEPEDAGRALELYKQACDLFEIDDKEYYGLDAFRNTVAAAIKCEKYEDALEILQKLVAIHEKNKRSNDVYKTFLSIVVIHLVRNDYVAADQTFQKQLSFPGFGPSEESRRASDLLDAWHSNDAAALAACIKQQTFEFLDPPVARLARALKLGAEGHGLT